VLGATFTEGLLPAVFPDESDRPDDLVWAGIAEFIGKDPGGTFEFRHALIRDAAYEGLSYRLRRDLHARVAETIERAVYPNLEEAAEVLALHYFAARRYDAAWLQARIAASRAQAIHANAEAVAFYERAIEAARHVPDVPTAAVSELYESLGDVRERLGEYARAGTAYRAARKLVPGDPVAEARLLLKQGWIPDRSGRFTEALRWIGRGLRRLEGVTGQAAARQRAQLTVWYAAERQAQGRHAEAIRWCRRAVAEAEAAGERDALAHAYYLLDWALVDVGKSEEAGYSEAALSIYEELGDLSGQATVLNNMAGFAYLRGRWPEAMERYRRAREASTKAGDSVNAAVPAAGIAEILLEQGRLEEAEALLREALRVWRAAGHWWGIAYATLNLGRVAARAGDADRARSLLEEARDGFLRGGAASFALESDARLAEAWVLDGRGDEALPRVTELLEREVSEGGSATHGPFLQRIRGHALMQLRDLTGAREALEESLRLGRSGTAAHEVALTLLALADLASLEERPLPAGVEAEARETLHSLGIVSVPHVPRTLRSPSVSV